jgi:hypothetical protein
MIDYIEKYSNLSQRADTYILLLRSCPSLELANLFSNIKNRQNNQRVITIDQIIEILLSSEQPDNGLTFLRNQIVESTDLLNEDEMKKLKSSYEMLLKYSFLAQQDEEFTKEKAVESRDQIQMLWNIKNNNTLPISHKTLTSKQKSKLVNKMESNSIPENDNNNN